MSELCASIIDICEIIKIMDDKITNKGEFIIVTKLPQLYKYKYLLDTGKFDLYNHKIFNLLEIIYNHAIEIFKNITTDRCCGVSAVNEAFIELDLIFNSSNNLINLLIHSIKKTKYNKYIQNIESILHVSTTFDKNITNHLYILYKRIITDTVDNDEFKNTLNWLQDSIDVFKEPLNLNEKIRKLEIAASECQITDRVKKIL